MPLISQAKSFEGKSWAVLSDVCFVSTFWISDRNWQFKNLKINLWKETTQDSLNAFTLQKCRHIVSKGAVTQACVAPVS